MNSNKPLMQRQDPHLAPIPVQLPGAADKIIDLPTDTKRISRVGFIVLGLGLGGMLLWASFAGLDEGVPTFGSVAIDTKRKAVQHLQGGIIKEVLVREGQFVEAGQPLLKLGDSTAKANFEMVRQQYLSLKATEARLLAEQLGAQSIAFDPQLVEAARQDPGLARQMEVQRTLLQSRRDALVASMNSLKANIVTQESNIDAAKTVERNLLIQQGSLNDELSKIRELVKEGYVPLVRQMDLERRVAEVGSALAQARASQTQATQTIFDIRQRLISVKAEHDKEVDSQMSQIRPELQATAERYKAISEELARTEIKSPATGQVVGLGVQAVGAVIQPGQKIMDIVPGGEELVLETKIAPNLIDRVKAGDPVDVRFNTFAHSPQLVVAGVLRSVSADVLTDPGNPSAPPYYLGRVTVTPEGINALGDRKLQPGMPVEIVVKTGRRTLLQYILHPLTKRMAASMKEE